MKLEENLKDSLVNSNNKPNTIKTGSTSAETLKIKKVFSKKNNLAEATGNADALAVQKIAASIATIITLLELPL